MAQLLCISTASKKPTNNLGDVVGAFPDSHVFSAKERSLFDIVTVSNAEVEAATPEVRMIFLDPADDTWKVMDGNRPPSSLRFNPQTKVLSHRLTGSPLAEVSDTIKLEKQQKIAAQSVVQE